MATVRPMTKHQTHIMKIIDRLKKAYPDAKIVLGYGDPWELLVATILSAQCTDKKVNEVTGRLFAKYHTIEDYAQADPTEFEADIRPTGFFRNKTKNIIGAAQKVLADHGGLVPGTMDELVALPGVARKTANIVLGNAWGVVEGIAVDTHVFRLSHRLGISSDNDPSKVERTLMATVPKEDWFRFTYLLIDHGRAVCTAKRPGCHRCALADLCPSSALV